MFLACHVFVPSPMTQIVVNTVLSLVSSSHTFSTGNPHHKTQNLPLSFITRGRGSFQVHRLKSLKSLYNHE